MEDRKEGNKLKINLLHTHTHTHTNALCEKELRSAEVFTALTQSSEKIIFQNELLWPNLHCSPKNIDQILL